ncbi:MAG: ABC transporter substrate-binding protein [Deltaproteobacteria bacterium]|nr:ABC transporter substrate-binding protein [Deltaproteobacteria bacterium]TLN02235.1 MAG: ABC transporter substrate-binding protein [bacterium]
MRNYLLITNISLCFCLIFGTASATAGSAQKMVPPLDLERLKTDLSFVRGTPKVEGPWPRQVRYTFKTYDFRTDTFRQEAKTFVIKKKPVRIIPHAVGVAEILWAICPRERLVAFNEFAADPDSSFIADKVRARGPVFTSKQTELVIGSRPDLVFTVFYSGGDFKEKLTQAKIPSFDLGYFGTIESVKEQVLLMGEIIGEEGNAQALVRRIDARLRELKGKLPRRNRPVRVLYYDEGGYVPGASSNFTSICTMIGAVNVGAEQGIKSWSQIDYETVLKWNPDVIIVPERSKLKELLMSNRVLSHARAVKSRSVYAVPGVYLRVTSQFMLLSADYLAGIIYRQFR